MCSGKQDCSLPCRACFAKNSKQTEKSSNQLIWLVVEGIVVINIFSFQQCTAVIIGNLIILLVALSIVNLI